MNAQEIIAELPYSKPFLFVDELTAISENGIKGNYTFHEDESFYEGHFKNKPITPGVILIETMAQIGLVCLGIYLVHQDKNMLNNQFQIAFTSSEVDFYKAVLPNEKVTVTSTKNYFRFNKLKCKVEMHNEANELVCKGVLAGMIKTTNNEA